MRLLALDQAMHRTGYAVFEDGKVVRHGVLEVSHKFKGLECMSIMVSRIIALVDETEPYCVALEDVHIRRNAKTLMQLAEMRGAIRYGIIRWFDSIYQIDVSSNDIMKYLHLTPGTTRERKKHRARWVATEALGRDANMLGDDELVPSDEADAIIIGKIACEKLGLDTSDNQDYTDNSVK